MGVLLVVPTILLASSLIFLWIGLVSRKPKWKKDFFPNVSVISWFWKDGNIVERKIKNFLSLNYPGKYEIIIVDNASKDETKSICERYARKGLIKYYRSPIEYDRKAFALDEAIKKVAKYDILAMTDPDGVCEKNWLIDILQPFKNKKVGAVIGMTHCGNFYKNLFTKLRAVEDEWFYVISPLGRISEKDVHLVCGANYAVRRKALADVGYHGKKTLGEDFELTIKLHNRGWKVGVTDANVWQEEVENIAQYIRQRLRWQDIGFESHKYYLRQLLNIFKKRPVGMFLFEVSSLIPVFAFLYLLSMVYGLFYFPAFIFGLSSFLITTLAIVIGLVKFKRKHLIPYVPLYLIIEPILTIYCFLRLVWIKLVGRKIVWRSLYDGYYHSGARIVLK
jgi:cellulose synthase/poly-beta-1,6-N-acetylglucosamine synthase-like glycosyltransferase